MPYLFSFDKNYFLNIFNYDIFFNNKIKTNMNKNCMLNLLMLLSLTSKTSNSVNETKNKKAYFNFTQETIKKVNSGRNIALGIMGLPLIYCLNNENNIIKFLVGSTSLISTMSCFIIGKPEDEQPLFLVKKTVALNSYDKDLIKHYTKNPLSGNVNSFFVNFRED